MADTKISAELNSAIQAAVKREVARLSLESIDAEVDAAERGIRIDRPIDARYVIYWTAKVRL